eukprot:GFYU01005239.1.p1 GENE.GFYU01005239.1~~GFYU01005239.1.p1  ORF type:complete len:1869 (-),score=444.28 GFYU01005239.1:22-4860(-)
MVESEVTQEELSAVLFYLEECPDPHQVTDAATFLLHILATKNKAQITQYLSDLSIIPAMVSLMGTDDEKVRIVALQVAACLLDTLDRQDMVANLFSVMSEKLLLFRFTQKTYNILIRVLVGHLRDPYPEALSKDMWEERLDIDETLHLKVPEALSTIFRLLLGGENILRQAVLQDIFILMSSSTDNCGVFLQQFGWQNWMLLLLADRSEAVAEEETKVVHEMIMNVFQKLHCYSILNREAGWKTVEVTLTHLQLFAERGVLDFEAISRKILVDICVALHHQWSRSARVLTPAIHTNINQLAVIVEDTIFYPLDLSDDSGMMDVASLSASFTETIPDGNQAVDDSSFVDVDANTSTVTAPAAAEDDAVGEDDVEVVVDETGAPQGAEAEAEVEGDGESEYVSMQGDSAVQEMLDANGNDFEEGETATSKRGSPAAAPAMEARNMSFAAVSPTVRRREDENGRWSDRQLAMLLIDFLDLVGLMSPAAPPSSFVVGRSNSTLRIICRILVECVLGNNKSKGEAEEAEAQEVENAYDHLQEVFGVTSADDACVAYVLWTLFSRLKLEAARSRTSSTAQQLAKQLLSLLQQPASPKFQLPEEEAVNASLPLDLTDQAQAAEGGGMRYLLDMCVDRVSNVDSLIVTPMQTAATEILQREKTYIAILLQRRNKNCEAIRKVMDTESRGQMAYERIINSTIQNVHLIHCYEEVNRRSAVALTLDTEVSSIRRWRHVLRSLTNERGAWAATVQQQKQIFWKLDKTEDPTRRRRKLKRFYEGTDHRDASNKDNKPDPAAESTKAEEESKKVLSLKIAALPEGMREEELEKEDDTEWDLVGSDDESKTFVGTQESKLVYTVDCELVTPSSTVAGKLEVTTMHLRFQPSKPRSQSDTATGADTINEADLKYGKERIWPLESLREIHLRRYRLRRSAIEMFLIDNTNYFLTCTVAKQRLKLYNKIVSLKPPNLVYYNSRAPSEILKRSNLTARWQRRELSNFEYLMKLNTIAGRTHNDLTQYPIFPWVLSDYTSEELDLNDETIYRDLSKPVGALNEKRLEGFLERYRCLDDPEIPKFMYGSHYSTAGIVLFYLIRLEPFTTLSVNLQGGKFDHADRLFHSVGDTWSGVLTNSSDVKELIPEFFYLPEFLSNHNKFDLGTKQRGAVVDDVLLPPWAPTFEDFVRINREALESETVSNNLHHWIDLIFGYKQRGEEAVTANNVFYHLTYEGAVDLDKIEDPMMRAATEAQIDSFGQTPSQLLTKPHPKRQPPQSSRQPFYEQYKNMRIVFSHQCTTGSTALLYVGLTNDRLVVVDSARVIEFSRWDSSDPSPAYGEIMQWVSRRQMYGVIRRVGVPYASDLNVGASFFEISPDAKTIVTCGHWDNSFKLSAISDGKVSQSISQHKDIVTCLALGEDKVTLVTGSRDTTLMVWEFTTTSTMQLGISKQCYLVEKPRQILYGHDDEVTCVAVSTALDIVASGSKDGTCIVHTVRNGKYVRTIAPYPNSPQAQVHLVAISSQGKIITYSLDVLMLHLYSINGDQLASIDVYERLNHIVFTGPGDHFLTGGEKGVINLRQTWNLRRVHEYQQTDQSVKGVPVTGIAIAAGSQHVLAGFQNGVLQVYGLQN